MSYELKQIVKNSRTAFVNKVESIRKDEVLKKFANFIKKNKKNILKENYKDIKFAKKKD